MKNISAAMVKAQKAFGPALKVKQHAHLKVRYADLASCVDAVIDAFNDAGIALVQKCLPCEDGVNVQTLFVHESGEFFDAGSFHVPASKQDAMAYGSALTYARKYSLMAACGIAPEDDDGKAASQEKSAQKFSATSLEALLRDIQDCINLEELKDAYAKSIAAVGTDAEAKKQIIKAKDEKKATL